MVNPALYAVRRELDARFTAALRDAGADHDAVAIVRLASRPEFGDYQVDGIMAVAGRLGRRPRELAEQVLARVELDRIASDVTVAGPGFMNIRLSTDFLREYLSRDMLATLRDLPQSTDAPCLVVDMSSPNLAKEMHVGHLRSTIIGDAMCRVMESLGYRVIRQNHVGDWGTQFGMLLRYMEELGVDAEQCLEDLEGFYQVAKRRFDTDAGFAEAARAVVVRLQSGDVAMRRKWQRFTEISLAHCQAIYDRLEVRLNHGDVRGESAYNDDLPAIVKALDEAGLLRESAGAGCVFLEDFKEPVIVQKSDGGYLYATTDLATVRYRIDVLKADELWYFVDARQTRHLAQVFAVSRAAGFVPLGTAMRHHSFGMILDPDGKPFRTRDGGIVKLDALLAEAEARALPLVRDKNPALSLEECRRIAGIVGIGAVKYADLVRNRKADYVFDWDDMLSFDGNTGPYLQYAYTRIASLFRRAGISLDALLDCGPMLLEEPQERALALRLVRYADVLESVAGTCCPHYLCGYLHELATAFSTFYESCPVLDAAARSRASRLYLCQLSAWTLRRGLSLLGIGTAERM